LKENRESIEKSGESLGASGSFFFFSFDKRLVIKTITEKECQMLLKILPEYYKHILKYPNSLISRTYGLFYAEIAGVCNMYFVMMENSFRDFEENNVLYTKYDLKGSTIKRFVKNTHADVFKDINLLSSDDAFLVMSAERKAKLVAQINADVSLLMSKNIMDYSLLLGIGYEGMGRDMTNMENEIENENEWRYFRDGNSITGSVYCLSLIDYLQ
jgi:1-phosphatidylinositol-4-phosphate 5-kinase